MVTIWPMVTIWNAMRSDIKPTAPASPVLYDKASAGSPAAARIAAFLDGRTNGEDVLHALYDYVLDEPVPERMQALLRKS